jgi:hypothetical protein
MFRIEAENKEFEKVVNRHLAMDVDDEYSEGNEIQAHNLVHNALIDNQLYYYAVDLFFDNQIIGCVAAEN